MFSLDEKPSPLGAVTRGVLSGVVGTAAMTAVQALQAKLQSSGGGEQSDSGGEQSQSGSGEDQPKDPWEEASAPAQVAQRVARGVFHKEIPADRIETTTNAMHWSYGTGWGAVYGLISGGARGAVLRRGLAFGTAVWGAAYVEMVPMGLYQPPWKYGVQGIATELGYHLVYGTAVALAYDAFEAAR